MNLHKVIRSQYLASLGMLKQVIISCPQSVWDAPEDGFKIWSKSYHVLFYAHLYLQSAEKDFVPWEKHHDPDGEVAFTKDEVLEYLSFVEKQVVERLPATDMEAESGFHWYPVNKLELQFINIRHIQQHTGELYERVGTHENIELGWVGFSRILKENE
ncbi:MAG TPA: DinB family protein [Anaerolineales bacterium]|nr:DinB family protein [Anaerolineales bacterium]